MVRKINRRRNDDCYLSQAGLSFDMGSGILGVYIDSDLENKRKVNLQTHT
jgi:hypothetical protein